MKIKCDSCNGTGEVMYSCCTGEIIDDDIAMCPTCHEHLGDETCEDCGGLGEVEEDTVLSPKATGLQSAAENYADSIKDQEQ